MDKIDYSKLVCAYRGWYYNGLPFEMTTEHREKYDYYRFWSKVDIKANPDICWNWKATKNKSGYGNIIFEGDTLSNRVAYRLYYGNFDKKLCVLHKCDNPSCCNPNHLYLGTKKDNANDKILRGRCFCVKGENNPSAKLTEQEIVDIVNFYKMGVSKRMLAIKYNMSFTNVCNILKGKTWNEVTKIKQKAG